jgi:hypothetical protein
MKKNIANNKIDTASTDKNITRKEAIKKAGVTALTAASLMFLSTKNAAADSSSVPSGPPQRGW